GGPQSLYRIPATAGLGNICYHKPRHNRGPRVVSGHGDGLVSSLYQPAIEELANEVVGFDDDDAALGRHRNSWRVRTRRHPSVTPPVFAFETRDAARLWHSAAPI